MEKIPTLFVRDKRNMSLVTQEPTPGTEWIFNGEGTPTVKKDGTNIAVSVETMPDGGRTLTAVFKRRNPTRKEKDAAFKYGLPKPEPTYVRALREAPEDKHIYAAVDSVRDWTSWPVGIWPCEALGPKIQGGIESSEPKLYVFTLWPDYIYHDLLSPPIVTPPTYYYDILEFLDENRIEGIVWHGSGGRYAKIKRRDYGLSWPPKEER